MHSTPDTVPVLEDFRLVFIPSLYSPSPLQDGAPVPLSSPSRQMALRSRDPSPRIPSASTAPSRPEPDPEANGQAKRAKVVSPSRHDIILPLLIPAESVQSLTILSSPSQRVVAAAPWPAGCPCRGLTPVKGREACVVEMRCRRPAVVRGGHYPLPPAAPTMPQAAAAAPSSHGALVVAPLSLGSGRGLAGSSPSHNCCLLMGMLRCLLCGAELRPRTA